MSTWEYAIEDVTTGSVEEVHTPGLRDAICQLMLMRETVPDLIANLRSEEAAGTATHQMRTAVAREAAARYRIVRRPVGSWEVQPVPKFNRQGRRVA